MSVVGLLFSRSLRRFGRVIFSAILSLGVLILVNVLLPRATSPEVFGEWRKVVLAMVPVGVVHLGMADALFKAWSQGTAGLIGLRNIPEYLLVVAVTSVLYTGLVDLLGLIPDGTFLLFLVFAVLSGLHAILLAKLLAEQEARLFVLRYSAQPLTILLLLGLSLLGGQPSVTGLLTMYVLATLFAALVLVPGSVTAGSRKLPSAKELVLDLGGMNILLSNLLFLALVNVDKFTLSFSASLVDFASYNLMSTVILASSTIFGQIGNAIYAQGLLEHTRAKGVLLGGIAAVFATLLAVWGVVAPQVAAFFPGYDLRLFDAFLPAAALMSMIAIYYLPLLKYAYPQKVSAILVAVTLTYLAAFFGLRRLDHGALWSSIVSYSVALVLFVALSEAVMRKNIEARKVLHEH